MLIATVTALILLFGGGSAASDAAALKGTIAQMRDVAPDCIEDEARLAKFQSILDEVDGRLDQFFDEMKENRKEILTIDARYEANVSDYQVVIRKIEASFERFQDDLLRTRFEMRDQMTREEWKKFFDKLDKPEIE